MKFEPLHIEFSMGSPVLLTYPFFSLDGNIAFAVAEEEWGDPYRGQPQIPPDWSSLPIPLLLEKNGKHSFYHASISRFSENFITKSPKLHRYFGIEGLPYLKNPKNKYMVVGGDFKMNQKEYIQIATRKVHFWVVGNKEKLQKLIAQIYGLGKRTSSGFGRINEFTIESSTEDYSIQHPHYGLNRPIPKEWGDNRGLSSGACALLAIKGPYWAKSNHTKCYVPDGFN